MGRPARPARRSRRAVRGEPVPEAELPEPVDEHAGRQRVVARRSQRARSSRVARRPAAGQRRQELRHGRAARPRPSRPASCRAAAPAPRPAAARWSRTTSGIGVEEGLPLGFAARSRAARRASPTGRGMAVEVRRSRRPAPCARVRDRCRRDGHESRRLRPPAQTRPGGDGSVVTARRKRPRRAAIACALRGATTVNVVSSPSAGARRQLEHDADGSWPVAPPRWPSRPVAGRRARRRRSRLAREVGRAVDQRGAALRSGIVAPCRASTSISESTKLPLRLAARPAAGQLSCVKASSRSAGDARRAPSEA